VTLIIGATSTFAELQSDLDRIWRAPEIIKPAGIWGLLRTRLLSFGLIVSSDFSAGVAGRERRAGRPRHGGGRGSLTR
jgi:hypothetical protein